MLLREEGDAVVCIGQPAHAWVSGQIARAWGEPPDPWEEVCLAAEQHDIGMAQWDLAPELNPETGRPYSFMQMHLPTHVALWAAAPRLVLAQSRYAAVPVSMHGVALYERRDLDALPAEEARIVREYLDSQRRFQDELIESLGAGRTEVKRNQQLVWAWDSLSLGLCLGWDLTEMLDPWPFRDPHVEFHTEGRRLEGRFGDEAELRAAFAEAPWVTLEFALDRPG
jgi:Protein of unknown function (DUF3891)